MTSLTALVPGTGPALQTSLKTVASRVVPLVPNRVAIDAALAAAAERHDLDPAIVMSIAQAESRFDPGVVSDRGAVGLMQVLPTTAREMGYDAAQWDENILAGAQYLRSLLSRYGEDRRGLQLAIAAYNAGPGNVDRYGGIPPFATTRAYVRRVLKLYEQYRQASVTGDGPQLDE